MFGLDTVKRLIWGELPKDKVRNYVLDKIKTEEEHQAFLKKCKETPSFSRCVIDNGTYKRIKHTKSQKESVVGGQDHQLEKSQKQKAQLKSYNLRSYKDAVVEGTEI